MRVIIEAEFLDDNGKGDKARKAIKEFMDDLVNSNRNALKAEGIKTRWAWDFAENFEIKRKV